MNDQSNDNEIVNSPAGYSQTDTYALPMTPPAPISPPTITSEDDMGMIKDFFTRAANTIVEAAGLRKDIAELRSAVSDLKTEVEHVRSQNKWLDEQLANVRKSRDDYAEQLRTAHAQLDDTRVGFEHTKSKLQSTLDELNATRAQRDEGWDKATDLGHQLDGARDTIEGFKQTNNTLITERDTARHEVEVLNEQLDMAYKSLHSTTDEKNEVWRQFTELTTKHEAVKSRLDEAMAFFRSAA